MLLPLLLFQPVSARRAACLLIEHPFSRRAISNYMIKFATQHWRRYKADTFEWILNNFSPNVVLRINHAELSTLRNTRAHFKSKIAIVLVFILIRHVWFTHSNFCHAKVKENGLKMSHQVPATKTIHFVKVEDKILENNLTRIQWPQLNDKQAKKVQETITSIVSKNMLFWLKSHRFSSSTLKSDAGYFLERNAQIIWSFGHWNILKKSSIFV